MREKWQASTTVQLSQDHLNHTLKILRYIQIVESNHPVASAFKEFGPSSIVFNCDLMLAFIDLNYKIVSLIAKVDYVRSNWDLSSELESLRSKLA